eukprot:gene19752-2722_t
MWSLLRNIRSGAGTTWQAVNVGKAGIKIVGAGVFLFGVGIGAGRAVPFAVKDYLVRSGKDLQPTIHSTRTPILAAPSSDDRGDTDAATAKISWWGRSKPQATEVKTWLVLVPMTNHSLKVTLLKNPTRTPPPAASDASD